MLTFLLMNIFILFIRDFSSFNLIQECNRYPLKNHLLMNLKTITDRLAIHFHNPILVDN